MTVVRIRQSGQVLDMVPAVAAAMIAGGTAEEVRENEPAAKAVRAIEAAAVDPRHHAEAAVASAQRQKAMKAPARNRAR